MSGIAGIFHLEAAKPVDPARIKAMTEAFLHRGPDGGGVWTAPGIGLGHRRLAIIDPVGGAQPMASEDDALVISFDGEIYNYRELGAELVALGARLASNSDIEVILHAWRHWGPACLDRLHGMFAFALYDQRERSLFLARDRLGVKPLHYTELRDGSIGFSSEIKGLLAHPLMRRSPDIRAAEDYLAYGYVPDDRSILLGVHKLPAGHYLKLTLGQPLAAPATWWDVSFADRTSARASALEEELAALMRQAITSHMIADVPLGAFLSGEVDSSSVVALMAEASSAAVRTCAIGFDQAGHDESRHAAQVAERFATDHRTRTVAADDFGPIDRLVSAFDEPFADASALTTYRACDLARESMTVALSGDGADEAMAGSPRYASFAAEARARAWVPGRLRRSLFGALGAVYPRLDRMPRLLHAKATLLALAKDDGEAYADAVCVTNSGSRERLFSEGARRELGGYRAEDRYVTAMRDAPARDPLDRAQYADLKIRLPGEVLTRIDRMSMAVSLEAREPLLDHRLVEFAARLPARMRSRGGTGKWLMKRAMRRYLPEDILHRRKTDVGMPISDWFRGPLAEEARRIAEGSALGETGWFDMGEVRTLIADHQRGAGDHGRTIWQLLMLEKSLNRMFRI